LSTLWLHLQFLLYVLLRLRLPLIPPISCLLILSLPSLPLLLRLLLSFSGLYALPTSGYAVLVEPSFSSSTAFFLLHLHLFLIDLLLLQVFLVPLLLVSILFFHPPIFSFLLSFPLFVSFSVSTYVFLTSFSSSSNSFFFTLFLRLLLFFLLLCCFFSFSFSHNSLHPPLLSPLFFPFLLF
jgi:hypothetical protein